MITSFLTRATILLAALCISLSSLAHACPSPNQTLQRLDYLRHVKRWYSVGNPASNEPPVRLSWPVLKPAEGLFSAYQPLRYCWRSQSDYDTLNAVLQAAIEMWKPAMRESALQIVPDKGAKTICEDPGWLAADDAFEIEDITEVPEMQGVAGAATMGYYGADEYRRVNGPESARGRHGMIFSRIDTESGGAPGPYDVRTMAHELGHAIGLAHEHSRHDRETYVWFYCENLRDYDTLSDRLSQLPGATVEQACSDMWTASQLGFSSTHYIPEPGDGALGMMQWSKSFDYDSIMNYASNQAAIGLQFPEQAVLVGHSPGEGEKASKEGAFQVFTGGSADPAQATISEGDIARVAQLYPNQQAGGAEVAAQTSWAPTSSGFAMKEKRTAVPLNKHPR